MIFYHLVVAYFLDHPVYRRLCPGVRKKTSTGRNW